LETETKAGARTYAGLFIVTLATLIEEILLTRIFSVTMWYHFVFVAISVAMFGLTVGGLLVYLAPGYFTGPHSKKNLAAAGRVFVALIIIVIGLYICLHLLKAALLVALFGLVMYGLVAYLTPQLIISHKPEELLSAAALGFAVTTVGSFLVYLAIPPVFNLTVTGILSLVTILGVISIPFIFSGIVVCLALTKFPRQVSQMYSADLSGAAAGCILIIYALRFIDAPTLVIFSGALAGAGAFLFALGIRNPWLRQRSLQGALLIAALGAVNLFLAGRLLSMLKLEWMSGKMAETPIYEKWNSFSRVVVAGNPDFSSPPFGWGLSPAYPKHSTVRQLSVLIDAGALTVLTHNDGDFGKLDYLRYDVTNIAHYVRPDSNVVVIGAGGGRDVLSALAFNEKSVTAIEMNQAVLHALNGTFGDFTGHLDRDPRVRFVNDEARSYIARMPRQVDIIQASLVDTWAATSAGAFALAENSIYTTDAWSMFLNRLTPRGLLTFTRWYYDAQHPAETYRLVSLASTALSKAGVASPRNNLVLVECPVPWDPAGGPEGVATILVSRTPFSPGDLDLIQKLADQMKFQILLSPRQAANTTFARLATGSEGQEFAKMLPGRIAAPTDDSPFFLCNFGVRDVFSSLLVRHSAGVHHPEFEETVGAMSIAVTLLTLLCIVIPWFLMGRKAWIQGTAPLFVFFASIGLGFMLVEVSQLQRLMIFLGHPTYSLSTVLFTLLLSSGLGSLSTGSSQQPNTEFRAAARLLGLLVALVLFGLLTPHAVAAFASASTPARVGVAAGIIFPLGFFMGMAFPLGMKAASAHSEALTPWLWGLNGATSVLASVIAFLVVLGLGVSAAFWAGSACYVVATASLIWTTRG